MEAIFEIESYETFQNVSQEILDNLYDTKCSANTNVEPHLIQSAKEDLKRMISKSNFNFITMMKSLQDKGWNQERIDCFLSLLNKRKIEILFTTLMQHNKTYGETITEFDWCLKLVCGINDLKTLSYPLLQLILSTINSNGEQKKTIYDINKEVLAKIINILENTDEIQYFLVLFVTRNL